MVSSLVQVVVFALGIGTTMNHAEKLIDAFQNLHQKLQDTTASPHQLASGRPPWLSQVGSSQAGDHDSLQPSVDTGDSLQPSVDTGDSLQPSVDTGDSLQSSVDTGDSLQLMSLRDAFFAKSVR